MSCPRSDPDEDSTTPFALDAVHRDREWRDRFGRLWRPAVDPQGPFWSITDKDDNVKMATRGDRYSGLFHAVGPAWWVRKALSSPS